VDVKVDISTGDIITEQAIKYGHNLLLENRIVEIMTYTIETIISEKLETIVDRSIANTRLKDFYDLYALDNQKSSDINFNTLNNAIRATVRNRGTIKNISRYTTTISILKTNITLNKLWKSYQKPNKYAQNISFEDACDAAIDLVKKSKIE